MLGIPESSMVKKVHTDTVDPVAVCHPPSGSAKSQECNADTDERQNRIMWTREQMLSIAPECKSLPEGLGIIPEDMANLFHVRQPTPVRPRGKGRVTASVETSGRKRVDDTVRSPELSTSAWRKKDRVMADTVDRTECHGGPGRTGADAGWRPRKETNDNEIWNAPSPSVAGATDGWLMPDADEVYELGGNSNNVDAFEAMRQQARAEWAQSEDVKPVQDSATEVLMNDLIAEAGGDASAILGAPPGLKEKPASPSGQGLAGPPHKIDVQSLFNAIPAAPPGLKPPIHPNSFDRDSAEKGTVAFAPPESEMRSTLPSVPRFGSEDAVAPDSKTGIVEGHRGPAPEEGLDRAAEDLSLLSSSHTGRRVDVSSLFNDGGIDDSMPGFAPEDVPVSQEMPLASSPPPSSPRGSIWGPGLDAGAAGSTITSTDWTQMQEIWKREPASKSQEAVTRPQINDGFSHEHLTGSSSTSVAGMTHAHAMLGDSLAYSRRAGVAEVPSFAAAQGPQRGGVHDSMMALASMSLLSTPNTSAEKQVHQDNRQLASSVGVHGTQVHPNYGAVNMARRQPQSQVQQGQAGHMVSQPRGAAEDPHTFEIYLKQLVANAQQQQQQQQVSEQQRVQAAVGSRSAHPSSVMHPRGPTYSQTAVSNQQASMEQIRKLAPALQLTGAAVPQQRQMGPMPAARQQQHPVSTSYSNLPQGHRMQDPSWMLRQLKGAGHPQAHVAGGNPALQQSWATPTHMQVQYPASSYDRRGHQATLQQYGAAAHTARAGLQQTHAALQGLYADQLARAALQSARQPQQQAAVWLPQATAQGSAYPAQVRPAHVQGLQQAVNRGGQYAVQSSLPRYYSDNTQPGYTTLYRQ